MTATDSTTMPEDVAWLDANSAKSRYGVSYVAAICAQAGLGFTETPPDQDRRAIDGSVDFESASVWVQVKCTGRFKISRKLIRIEAKPEWFVKWARMFEPVYLVAVVLDEPVPEDWLIHKSDGTWHRSAAFWTRVDKMSEVPGITIPTSQRLTIETLSTWKDDLYSQWESGSGRGSP